jgi:predicted dehydrogenase/threonine dehydrogenase-like Zn-dependent dehydrogenase
MHQVIQDCRSGRVTLAELPAPAVRPGTVVVQTHASLVSAGTEGAILRFGQQNLLQKARSRPDLARQVLDRVRAQGLQTAYQMVQSRLSVPLALGYSSAGHVLEVGPSVDGIRPGDRLACAGGHAGHAEIVTVPRNLLVAIPEGVTEEDAAFAAVGAVALQGVREADVRVGERVFVIGLGLVGLLTVQLLKAAGCLVLGTDLNPLRVALACELGANEACVLEATSLMATVSRFTSGRGVDAVIVTAASKGNGPIELAGEAARQKGRIVAVGDIRMDVPRRVFYEKELELRVSRSYGPGRYDPQYEERGIDYPYAYVPFTEQRNLETFLALIAEGRVTPHRLITHRFPIDEAEKAYALLRGEVKEPYLGVMLTYPTQPDLRRTIPYPAVTRTKSSADGRVSVGLIGAGNYACLSLLPNLAAMKEVRLVGVSTARGVSGWDAVRRFGFTFATTDTREILENDSIDLVVIATRHGSHASLAEAALRAGKHVFVEKPLATREEDLRQLVALAEAFPDRHLMVGFNRRFARLTQSARLRLRGLAPLAMLYRVNAGALAATHWAQDAEEGGGRIVGEVCHFVDLLQYLCGSAPVSVFATSVRGQTSAIPPEDIVSITLGFADGSLGTIHYFANGSRAVPKEYLEVHGGGATFVLDDFRRARWAAGGKVERWRGRSQDKGQGGELQAIVDAVRSGGPTPIPLAESVLSSLATFRILDSLRSGLPVAVGGLPIADWRPGEPGCGHSERRAPALLDPQSTPEDGDHATG